MIVLDKDENKMMPFGMNKVVAINNEDSNFVLCYKIFDILWLKV
jgi:hypothetical protein